MMNPPNRKAAAAVVVVVVRVAAAAVVMAVVAMVAARASPPAQLGAVANPALKKQPNVAQLLRNDKRGTAIRGAPFALGHMP